MTWIAEVIFVPARNKPGTSAVGEYKLKAPVRVVKGQQYRARLYADGSATLEKV
jgi:hypothetical protein